MAYNAGAKDSIPILFTYGKTMDSQLIVGDGSDEELFAVGITTTKLLTRLDHDLDTFIFRTDETITLAQVGCPVLVARRPEVAVTTGAGAIEASVLQEKEAGDCEGSLRDEVKGALVENCSQRAQVRRSPVESHMQSLDRLAVTTEYTLHKLTGLVQLEVAVCLESLT
ncbi:hypothetical protein ON010_g8135 [Phytophthora cinnamomi]|nr:hypothetical protein ON010_g8135 [Phytophthora cinnamomi]